MKNLFESSRLINGSVVGCCFGSDIGIALVYYYELYLVRSLYSILINNNITGDINVVEYQYSMNYSEIL